MTAVEPSDVAWRLAEPRIAAGRVPVRRGGLDGARLDLPDASMDTALSTFTLCTIADLDAALAEVTRVLRPGGRLHFLEHGLAPDEGTVRWQRRLDGFQQRAFGGCHLTRDIPALLSRAGFEVEVDAAAYLPGPSLSHPWGYVHRGRARRPGGGPRPALRAGPTGRPRAPHPCPGRSRRR